MDVKSLWSDAVSTAGNMSCTLPLTHSSSLPTEKLRALTDTVLNTSSLIYYAENGLYHIYSVQYR